MNRFHPGRLGRRVSFVARGLVCLPASDDFPDGIEDGGESRRRLSPPRGEGADWTVRTFRDETFNLDWRGELTIRGPTGRHMRGSATAFTNKIFRKGALVLEFAEDVQGACYAGDWLIFVSRRPGAANENRIWYAPKASPADYTLLQTVTQESTPSSPWFFSPDGTAGHCIEWAASYLHLLTINPDTDPPGLSYQRIDLPGLVESVEVAASTLDGEPLWSASGHFPLVSSRAAGTTTRRVFGSETACGIDPRRHVLEIVYDPFETEFSVDIADRDGFNDYTMAQRYVMLEDSEITDFTADCSVSDLVTGYAERRHRWQLYATPPWGVEESVVDLESYKRLDADGSGTYDLTYSLTANYRLYCAIMYDDELPPDRYNAVIAQITETAEYIAAGETAGNKAIPVSMTATYFLRRGDEEVAIGTRDLSYTGEASFFAEDVCNQGCGANTNTAAEYTYGSVQVRRDAFAVSESAALNRVLFGTQHRGPLEIEWSEDGTNHSYHQVTGLGQLVARDYHTDSTVRDITVDFDALLDTGGAYSRSVDYRMYDNELGGKFKQELTEQLSAGSRFDGYITIKDHEGRTLLAAEYSRVTDGELYERDRTFNYQTEVWTTDSESTTGTGDTVTVTSGTPDVGLLLLDPRSACSLHIVTDPDTETAAVAAVIEGLNVAGNPFAGVVPGLDECLSSAGYQPVNRLGYTPVRAAGAGLLARGVWYYLVSVEVDGEPVHALVDSAGVSHDPVAITGIIGADPTFDPVGVI